MRVSHTPSAVDAVFDDPNLVSCAGLAPVLALGQRCGLHDLVDARVAVHVPGGANPAVKVPALIAGMVAGWTASTIWTCSGTAGWTGCSARCGHPRRWARSCAACP